MPGLAAVSGLGAARPAPAVPRAGLQGARGGGWRRVCSPLKAAPLPSSGRPSPGPRGTRLLRGQVHARPGARFPPSSRAKAAGSECSHISSFSRATVRVTSRAAAQPCPPCVTHSALHASENPLALRGGTFLQPLLFRWNKKVGASPQQAQPLLPRLCPPHLCTASPARPVDMGGTLLSRSPACGTTPELRPVAGPTDTFPPEKQF